MQRVGIYPGTFDPIHKGHLSFALESIKTCQLDRVIFLPESQPRAKVDVTPIEQRIKQIQASVKPYSEFDVRSLKSSRFTVDKTLREIQQLFVDAELTLLVGSDVTLGLHKWENIMTLLKICDIAIGMRSRESDDDIDKQLRRLQQLASPAQFTIVRTDHPSLASSTFRSQIKKLG